MLRRDLLKLVGDVIKEQMKYSKSNANVAKYARRVNLRDNNVIISKIKGVYLVKKV